MEIKCSGNQCFQFSASGGSLSFDFTLCSRIKLVKTAIALLVLHNNYAKLWGSLKIRSKYTRKGSQRWMHVSVNLSWVSSLQYKLKTGEFFVVWGFMKIIWQSSKQNTFSICQQCGVITVAYFYTLAIGHQLLRQIHNNGQIQISIF